MSITDAIVATFAATIFLAAVIFYVTKGVKAVWKLLCEILNAVRSLTARVAHAAEVADRVGSELAYVRQVTQQQMAPAAQEEVAPPVGRRSTMPPAFPQRDFYDGPPARPEDTDVSLLRETDEDVIAAQDREERRAHGIEPDEDEVPQESVREDV